MSSSLNYACKQAEKREAYAEYNAASRKLELAKIYERLAEIESQYEPLAKLTDDDEVRHLLIAFAKFVVHGSWPSYVPDIELIAKPEEKEEE